MSDTKPMDEQKSDEQPPSSQQPQAEAPAKAQEYAEKLKDAADKAKEVEGALFTGVEAVCGGVKKMNAKVTVKANKLLSKATGYFKKSIESYKKAGK
jgi:hypothetical protein